MSHRLRTPPRRDPMLDEFGVGDVKEFLFAWGLPLAILPPVGASERSVRDAFQDAGYNVLHFLKLRRAGNQFNELALRCEQAPVIDDVWSLTNHIRDILSTAGVESSVGQVTVTRHLDRVWVNFARLLPPC